MFRVILIGFVIMSLSSPPVGTAALPPGSSVAFVSEDPVIRAAVDAYTKGQLNEAAKLLADPAVADVTARDELIELARRLRREYSMDRDVLLEKLRVSIPDVTAQDLDRWIAAGQVQHRMIDGELCFFRREPGQILRFCKEAMDRRDAHKARVSAEASKEGPTANPAGEWTLHDHLAKVIAAADASDSPEVLPIRTRVNYSLVVKPNRLAKRGSVLRAWLPFPQTYNRQQDGKLLRSEPAGAVIADSAIDGDPVSGPAQRTVYLERIIDDPSQPAEFRVEFEFVTSAYYPKLDDARSEGASGSPGESYLQQRPPHIVFTPELQRRVDEIVGEETNPLIKARMIFNWLDANLRWTPEEEYCVIPNLSMHGLTRGKGDCGVASLTFITMCRIAGVPARWQSGWTTNPVGWNMHDWSEIYIAPWGWLPVDASYGRQKSDNPAIRDFYFGHTDSHRLIVNLDYGRELVPAKKSFRSEPLDFQRGEVELDGVNLYFDDWDYEIAFHRQELK